MVRPANSTQIRAEIPKKLAPLFQPKRYKVIRGGRGGAKSWGVARALIIMATQKKIRVGCFREIQNSLSESVHRLLEQQIESMGFSDIFEVRDAVITCTVTGSDFVFAGLFRNVKKIKSMEGIDIAWVEEAESVSDESWDLLTPTIRKPGSEIWIVYNPQFEEDSTHQRFTINPPADCINIEMHYWDNPYFPDVLRAEMEQDKARDPAKYRHKWLGEAKGGGRRVWPGFTRESHVREFDMDFIAKRGNCYMAMDPHSKYYPFILWIAILPKNTRGRWPEDFYKHVYNEWPGVDDLQGPYHDLRKKLMYTGSLADVARACYAHDGAEHGITIKSRLADPRYARGAGDWNWSTSTEGLVELFAKPEHGAMLLRLPEIKKLDAQRETIHADMLYNQHQERNAFNEPSFSVSPRCKNVITSLLNHRLEEDTDKEDEKFKDPSDALRIGYAGILPWDDPAVGASLPDGFRSQFTQSMGIV